MFASKSSSAPRRASFALALLFAACSSLALAQEVPATNPGFIERITDQQAVDPSFSGLVESQREWTAHVLKQTDSSREDALYDWAWVDNSGYDFNTKELGAQGIELLSSFKSLPEEDLDANMALVTRINNDAPPTTERYALVDAVGEPLMFYLADALGPRLGNAYIRAYTDGRLAKAVALLSRSVVSVGAPKKFFGFPRPHDVEGNAIDLVVDNNYVFNDGMAYRGSGFAFPSGHTTVGTTNALLLASMIPERFSELVARASGYGYDRLVMGVHYPLDVIGGRMYAEHNVTYYLNDPAYRTLFNQARDELRAALTAYCGMPLDQCAAPGDEASDPWASEAARAFHDYTMDYRLPALGVASRPMVVPEGAEVLLEAALPKLNAEQRRTLLEQTAEPSGEVLDDNASWQRLNLVRAYVVGSQQ